MAKAIRPKEMPALPEGATGWARSTKRIGGMWHAHALGRAICGNLHIDRHECEEAPTLGNMQYWGVCPRCYNKGRGL